MWYLDHAKGYEAGAVFRAENSDTHRHLTEYTGVDNGAAIEEHYHEALNTIHGVLKYVCKGTRAFEARLRMTRSNSARGLGVAGCRSRGPFDKEVQMLVASSWTDESRNPFSPLEHIRTRTEIMENYHKNYIILGKNF